MQLKTWHKVLLIGSMLIGCAVLVLVGIIAYASATLSSFIAPRSAASTQTAKWPRLDNIHSYPYIEPLELLKRADVYKGQPVCARGTVFYVRKSGKGTLFGLQAGQTDRFSVFGTVYYPGSIPGLVDDDFIVAAGYVLGTEEEEGLASSSDSVILLQRYRWMNLKTQEYGSTPGDSSVRNCY